MTTPTLPTPPLEPLRSVHILSFLMLLVLAIGILVAAGLADHGSALAAGDATPASPLTRTASP